MKVAANEIAENLHCSTEFPAEMEVTVRKKKRLSTKKLLMNN